MHLFGLLLLLVAGIGLSGCSNSAQSQEPSPKWTTGFWFWNGSSAAVSESDPVPDVLFVHVGTIRKETGRYAAAPWSINGYLPDELPAAHEYWIVFRYDRQGVPDLAAAPILAQRVSRLRYAAKQRNINITGVQLDIDSPTDALPQYAGFLKQVRKDLPAEFQISVTALLDSLRDGTAINDVIREVDEFVPQFYDISDPDELGAIAAKFSAAQWAPRFNRLGKRFRIGISTFGRARLTRKENDLDPRYRGTFYRDLTPLDIAINPAFSLQATRNEANELVLNYQATRKTRMAENQFEPGDTVQFILATPETVRDAVNSIKQIQGYSAGVVFFRWPAAGESMVMQPIEVLIAAGLHDETESRPVDIYLADGGCAAVSCMDVYLINAKPFSPQSLRYRIRSSKELEYFLPEEGMPVRMSGLDRLELFLPPYSGRGRMYLGRAVAATRPEFEVEEVR